jgi:hypothetical protein
MKTATISVRKHNVPALPLADVIDFLTEPFTNDRRLFALVALVVGTIIGSPVGLLV